MQQKQLSYNGISEKKSNGNIVERRQLYKEELTGVCLTPEIEENRSEAEDNSRDVEDFQQPGVTLNNPLLRREDEKAVEKKAGQNGCCCELGNRHNSTAQRTLVERERCVNRADAHEGDAHQVGDACGTIVRLLHPRECCDHPCEQPNQVEVSRLGRIRCSGETPCPGDEIRARDKDIENCGEISLEFHDSRWLIPALPIDWAAGICAVFAQELGEL